MSINLYSDGGSRGNPGLSAFGFCIFDGLELVDLGGEYMSIATNNQAEYNGLYAGLTLIVKKFPNQDVICFLDSELAVKQLNGEYKVKNEEIAKIIPKIRKLEKDLGKVEYKHVPRSDNKIADKIVNLILDAVEIANAEK